MAIAYPRTCVVAPLMIKATLSLASCRVFLDKCAYLSVTETWLCPRSFDTVQIDCCRSLKTDQQDEVLLTEN